MNGGDNSPVMTDGERRAYRYGQAASRSRLGGMRKSWSNDSLASSYGYGAGGRATCVCAPTTHPGSFRCKHHRNQASNLGGAAAAAHGTGTAAMQLQQEPSADDAGGKHHETEHGAPADQEEKSS